MSDVRIPSGEPSGTEVGSPSRPQAPLCGHSIGRIQALFGLSEFETQLMVMCAETELIANHAPVTFEAATAILPDAHLDAILPGASLRAWQILHVDGSRGPLRAPLRVDERMLFALMGMETCDPQLLDYLQWWSGPNTQLAPSHQSALQALVQAWSAPTESAPSWVELRGGDGAGKRQLCSVAAQRLGLRMAILPARAIPTRTDELGALARIWDREAMLSGGALLVDAASIDGDKLACDAVAMFVERSRVPVAVAATRRIARDTETQMVLSVEKPTRPEQARLWRTHLGVHAAGATPWIGRATSQFDMSDAAIHTVASAARSVPHEGSSAGADLWSACRRLASPGLEHLANRVEPRATWSDLVLPAPQIAQLQETVRHIRHRGTVFDTWGMGGATDRGRGTLALFSGPSGTGKTYAAEVIARELEVEMFIIDLSRVVSKYIGESEAQLREAFDAAECGGAVLVFDECDAMFGKRTDVRDSHDRFANIGISYLLQRVERFTGLAVLTTNLKDALDSAFARRISVNVPFPFPGLSERAELWRRQFGPATPTKDLDFTRLGQLQVTGGSIRNVAMGAAYLAVEESGPIEMRHLLQAARSECAKLERPLSDSEVYGWI